MKNKKVKKQDIDEDDLNPIIEVKPKKKEKTHYVDNKKFFAEMVLWKGLVKEALESGEEKKPPVTEYIGRCFLEIAENLARKPNFMNYHFKEDMIGDGIENCLLYCSNFNPEKSTNPFSYFTQIIYYAFLRRIQKEKKQNYVKYKFLESQDTKGECSKYLKFIGISDDEHEHYKTIDDEKTKKVRKKRKGKTLENFMEE
jgi:hypothetical protein